MQDSYLGKDLQKINLINTSLLRVKSQLHITLPSLTVVGFIHIGKSSTIEQLIGLQYLPNDRVSYNIQTWYPIEIHFTHTPQAQQFYAHIDGLLESGEPKVMTDVQQISEQLDKIRFRYQLKREFGKEAFHLRIFSAFCPTITIIDMPGLNLVEEYRNENSRVSRQILMRYLQQPYTVLLNVLSPTMQHYGKSILYFMHNVDPSQIRSLGCFTKLDLMDRGTDAVSMLTNQQISLRYGYVGIKNRSSYDRLMLSLEEGLKEEQKYFADHRIYSQLPQQLRGTASLSKKIVFAIYRQIKPQLKGILLFIKEKREELETKDRMQRQWTGYYLSRLIDAMVSIKDNICDDVCKNEVALAIRTQFTNFLKKQFSISPTESISNRQLKKSMSNWSTCSCCLIPGVQQHNSTFQFLIIEFLRKYKQNALQMAKHIHHLLKEKVSLLIQGEEVQMPESIHVDEMLQKVAFYLNQNYIKLDEYLRELFDSQCGYIFTSDPAYLQENYSINRRTGKRNSTQQQLRQNIDSYLRTAIKNLRDTIPKQIINFLFAKTIKQLEPELQKITKVNAVQMKEISNIEQQLGELNRLQQLITSDTVMMTVIEEQDQKVEKPKQNKNIQQNIPITKVQQQQTIIKIQQVSNQPTETNKKKVDFSRLFGIQPTTTKTATAATTTTKTNTNKMDFSRFFGT